MCIFWVLGVIWVLGGYGEKGGTCLVTFGGEVWVFWDFSQGSPYFGPWILLGLVPLEVFQVVWRTVKESGEVEPYLVCPDGGVGVD